jgi:hypothetical protein
MYMDLISIVSLGAGAASLVTFLSTQTNIGRLYAGCITIMIMTPVIAFVQASSEIKKIILYHQIRSVVRRELESSTKSAIFLADAEPGRILS